MFRYTAAKAFSAASRAALKPTMASRFYSSSKLSKTITLPTGETYEQPTGLFINNEFVSGKQGKTFGVINPSTEEEICEVAEAMPEDVDSAVDAAEKAFNSDWSFGDPANRGKVLYNLADLMEAHKKTLTSIESLDNGDVGLVINYLRFCAGYADKLDGEVVDTGSGYLNLVKENLWVFVIGPALATGNTVVLKPAEATPLSALYSAKLAKEAGVPAGVLNIVSGFGKTTGEAIATHPRIRKVAFTGSTRTGKHIMTAAAQSNIKKVTLELGGKSANIVFNDCNVDKTIQNIITGIFFNSGEVCCAGSRIFIQSGIYDTIIEKLKTAVQAIKVGNPFDPAVFQGAQTSQMQLDKILGYVEKGKEEGAHLLTGGEREGNKGYFIKPTLFTEAKPGMAIYEEEIFGPFGVITKFDTPDEALALANNSEYGLAAGIHTENLNTAKYVSDRLRAGTVWINTYNDFHYAVPFGGYKQSGIGREMGKSSFDNYTQVKAIRTKIDETVGTKQ
ncbi:hypothetical protein HII12_001740 [Brettanomyces bruxellensis]|uniref:Aldehyde dehydrogenase 5, mitochondrial n=1 Tax=Dekkera bruxellensis TaxID=5007 RepID=A0A8H6BJP6_DEKBR|nr:hypothetical protein HII12_001740 [Brettanomyces bruxellensis]